MADGGDDRAIRFTFGEMESRLARMHEIASDKRTQFQARLRNFQKLGLPKGVASGRGKTVHYYPGHVVELALALELTQLGLLPERLIKVVSFNKFPIFMAIRMAAQSLIDKGGFLPDRDRSHSGENMPQNTGPWWVSHDEADDPMSMFLYFDPSSLYNLMPGSVDDEDMASATFFYGGPGIIRENIVRWTAGPHVRRLAFINVTAMLWSLVVRSKPENQNQFLADVIDWSEHVEETYFMETIDGMDPERAVVIETYEDVVANADLLRSLQGVPASVADAMVRVAQLKIEEGQGSSPAKVQDALVTMGGVPDFAVVAMAERAIKAREARGEVVDEETRERVMRGFAMMPLASAAMAVTDRARLKKNTAKMAGRSKTGFNLREWLVNVSKDTGLKLREREDFANEFKDTPDGQLTDLVDVRLPYVIEPEDRSGPDLVVLVPGEQRLEIDAKLSAQPSPEEIRLKVDQLATPGGSKRSKIPPRLIFVPSERAFSTALEADPGLWDYAFDRDVLIVTPQHMAMMMNSMKKVWEMEWSVTEEKETVDGDR